MLSKNLPQHNIELLLKSQKAKKALEKIQLFLPEMVSIRHDLHAHPELAYEEVRTSAIIAKALKSYGYEVTTGLGKTGVVGQLKKGNSKKAISLRADFDALPINEETNLPYKSKTDGKMHACGHDGHTTILLSAARYFAQESDFDGTINLVFQPAEEGFAGAKAMIEDGLFQQFPCDAIFAIHNLPTLPLGQVVVQDGPFMPSSDHVKITIKGKGGHSAAPHMSVDPIVTSAALIQALQTIVARNVSPTESAVVTVGTLHAGSASNIIPEQAEMELSVRAFSKATRQLLRQRIEDLATKQAESFGATAKIDYRHVYPILVNHKEETDFAAGVAANVFGSEAITRGLAKMLGSEDFAYMLEQEKGCYLMLGNGDSALLHTSCYDFNDALIPLGACYWIELVESFLASS